MMCRFRQRLDCRLDLDLSLDRIEHETQIDSLVQNSTEAILEARSLSVPMWFVQIVIVLRSPQNSSSESHGRMLFVKLLRALRTLVKLGNLRFTTGWSVICVWSSETGPLVANCAHCDRATNSFGISQKSSRTSVVVCRH
jgi:hypothetical protein